MADTDRELLELSARAAGINWIKDCVWIENGFYSPLAKHERISWNPLTNDGDALHLAVKLGISITPYPIYNSEERHSVIAKQRRKSDTLREANPTEVIELYGDDPAAAWRRAIVRCAAEIGRAA